MIADLNSCGLLTPQSNQESPPLLCRYTNEEEGKEEAGDSDSVSAFILGTASSLSPRAELEKSRGRKTEEL